jgi:hypothetical protein
MKICLTIILLFFFIDITVAQKNWNTRDSVARGVSITVGNGISHYINTLNTNPNRTALRQNFYCYSFRLMWEPEYRLSLGIETGYYKAYEVERIDNNRVSSASLAVVPILFRVQMRFFKRFYASASTGVSFHQASIDLLGNQSKSETMGFSNLQFSVGYIYPITKQFGMGLETKFLSENKTEDMILMAEVVARYQFKKRFKRVRE